MPPASFVEMIELDHFKDVPPASFVEIIELDIFKDVPPTSFVIFPCVPLEFVRIFIVFIFTVL